MRSAALALVGLLACQRHHDADSERSASDCTAIVQQVRTLIAPDVAQVGSDAARMIQNMLPALEQSCEHDGWPPEVKQCIREALPGDRQAMARCSSLMPKELQERLQRKMLDANH